MDWIAEIDELHAWFEAYFLALESSTDRMEVALASGFTMTDPSGATSSRQEVIATVVAGHGHAESLVIETSDHRLIHAGDEVIVAGYTETHHLRDRRNDRRTTVVFVADSQGPNGLRWLHAHETSIT